MNLRNWTKEEIEDAMKETLYDNDGAYEILLDMLKNGEYADFKEEDLELCPKQ